MIAIAPYVVRSVAPVPAAVCALGAVIVARQGGTSGPASLLLAFLVVTPLALSVADPMHALVAASPTPLRRRVAVRGALLLPVPVGIAVLSLLTALAVGRPVAWPSIAAPVVAAAVVAASLVGARRWPGSESVAVGALVAVAVVAVNLPPPLVVLPAGEHRLVWVAAGLAAVTASAVATRDPAG